MNNYLPPLENNDWLSRLFRKANLTPLGAAVLLALLNLGTILPLAWIFGAWFPSGRSRGLALEPAAWFNDYLVEPVLLGFFIWVQSAGDDLIKKLINRKIVPLDTRTIETIEQSHALLRNPWLARASTLVGLLFVYWFGIVGPQSAYPSWVWVHPAVTWARAPLLFVVVYAIPFILFDLLILILTLSKMFRTQGIRVEPLHPDHAGGLGAIGRFSADLGYGIGALGLAVSVNIIQHLLGNSPILGDPMLLFSIALYVCIGPIVFFLPIWQAHLAMAERRQALLSEISVEFDAVFAELRARRSNLAIEVEPFTKKISQLKETSGLIEKFPTWPFNMDNLRKFSALTLSPFVPAAVSLFKDWLGLPF